MWLCWHGNSSGKRYVCIEFFFIFFFSPQFQVFHSEESLTTFPPPTHTQGSGGAFFLSFFFFFWGGGSPIKHPCSFKRMRVLTTSLESNDLLKYVLLLFQYGAEESTFPLLFRILQIKCKYKNTSIRLEYIFLLQLCSLVVDSRSTRRTDLQTGPFLRLKANFPVGYRHLVVGSINDNKLKIKRQMKVTSCHIYFYCKVNVISKM